MTNEEIMAEVLVDEYLVSKEEAHGTVSYNGDTYYLNMAGWMWLNARVYLREQEQRLGGGGNESRGSD